MKNTVWLKIPLLAYVSAMASSALALFVLSLFASPIPRLHHYPDANNPIPYWLDFSFIGIVAGYAFGIVVLFAMLLFPLRRFPKIADWGAKAGAGLYITSALVTAVFYGVDVYFTRPRPWLDIPELLLIMGLAIMAATTLIGLVVGGLAAWRQDKKASSTPVEN